MELRTEEHSVGELLKSSTPKQPVCVLSFLWSDLAVGFFLLSLQRDCNLKNS